MALDIFTGIQRACCFCNSSQPSPLGATAMTSKYAETVSYTHLTLPTTPYV